MKYADVIEEEKKEQPSLFGKKEAPASGSSKVPAEPPLEGAEAKGEPPSKESPEGLSTGKEQAATEQAPALPSPVKFDLVAAKERFLEYRAQVDVMWEQAKAMKVDNDKSNVDATELGTTAMALFKKIKEKVNEVPNYVEAKEYVETVDTVVGMLTEKLYTTKKGIETIVSITKEKISAYAVVLEANRRKQEAIEKQAREDLQKKLDAQAKETGTVAPQVPGPLITSKKEAPVRTEQGTSYQVPKWTFEVIERDLPGDLVRDLIMVAMQAPKDSRLFELATKCSRIMPYTVTLWEDTRIREAIKRGIREIAGLKITEVMETRFRTGKR